MKRLLALFVLAVPFSVSAATLTGKVETLFPKCRGCAPVVRIENGDTKTRVRGELALEVAAFDGETVTLTGAAGKKGEFEANGFAPGKESAFITGTVELVKFRCPPGARCIAIARTPKVYLNTVDGRRILVAQPDAKDIGLLQLEGALVTVRGDVKKPRGGEPTLYPETKKNLFVKAFLEKFKRGMNGQTHRATLQNGETILVSGSTLGDKTTVWMSGKMGQERISGAAMFEATSASDRVPVVPRILPMRPVTDEDGTNVARNASTLGGQGNANAKTHSEGAAAAGIARD